MDFSAASANVKSYNPHQQHHHHHGQQQQPQQQPQQQQQPNPAVSPSIQSLGGVKAEEAAAAAAAAASMATASPLTGFGVSAAGVNLSVNIGVNITGVPESAAAPWATAAAYTSR